MDIFAWKGVLIIIWFIVVPFISAVALGGLLKRFSYNNVKFLSVVSEVFLAIIAASIVAWIFSYLSGFILENRSIINFISIALYICTFYKVLLEMLLKMIKNEKDTRKIASILLLIYIVLNVLLGLIIKTF
jgi:predicted Na+-dependent transporter